MHACIDIQSGARGVWGHDPPGKLLKLVASEAIFGPKNVTTSRWGQARLEPVETLHGFRMQLVQVDITNSILC